MNYAEKARQKQLQIQQEKTKKAEGEKFREEMDRAESARLWKLRREKNDEIFELLKQFNGFPIDGGNATLKANDDNDPSLVVYSVNLDLSVNCNFNLGSTVISAKYAPADMMYYMNWKDPNFNVDKQYSFSEIEELMDGIADFLGTL